MSSDIEKLLGSHIAKIRKGRGLTQSELAELIDVSIETISRLERGVSVPSLKTVENLSIALNVPLKVLFDFKYTIKLREPVTEKEISKLLAYLRTKRISDIKMSYRVLRGIFEQIEQNYQPKR